MKNNWNKIIDSFSHLRVLVIGDVMVDNYMWGKVNRISPEAPVPIVSVEKKESRLGGAANVALNIQALGAIPVLCSTVGNDINGNLFLKLLEDNNLSTSGIVLSKKRITTIKTRVIAHNQQLVRVDEETDSNLDDKDGDLLFKKVESIIQKQKIDVLVFEDYDKGTITPELIGEVIALAKRKNIPVAVDPKKKNFNNYKGATLFKPNLKELKEGTKSDIGPGDIAGIKRIVENLKSNNKYEMVLLTLSDKGVLIYNNSIQKLIPAHIRQIADVSGAGDTVISVAALCLASGAGPEPMAALANLAGGLVCEQVGVVPIDRELLKGEAIKLNI